MMVLLLVVVVAAAGVAINWAYLVTVFQHQQQTADTISLAATPKLLDAELLCNMPRTGVDEVAEAKAVADMYRELSNAHVSSRFQLMSEDVICTPGRIDDTRLRGDDFVFVPSPPYNALEVVVHRAADGANPVSHLIGGFVGIEAADVTAASYAMLDGQVVGFRPQRNILAPLAPLAVSRSGLANRTQDLDGDGRLEFVLLLNHSDVAVADDATGALVDLGGIMVDMARIQSQLAAGGVSATELPGGKFGPLGIGPSMMHPNNPTPLAIPADQASPSETNMDSLVVSLNAIAASDNPTRVFPTYAMVFGGEAHLIGFVAAEIVSAEDEAEGGMTEHQRLKVTIEPCFLLHATVWTDPDAAARNLYVRRLRLIR